MKGVVKVPVVVRVTETGMDALKREFDAVRKPKISQIKAHFQEVVDEEMNRLIEKHEEELANEEEEDENDLEEED